MAITTPFRKRTEHTPALDPKQSIYDTWMQIVVYYQSLDFQQYFKGSSTFIVLFLNSFYLFLKFYQRDIQQESLVVNGKIILDDAGYYYLYTIEGLELFMVAISVINTMILFNQTKKVILFNHPTKPEFPDSEYDSYDLFRKTRNAKLEVVEDVGEKWIMHVWDPKCIKF
jgi:hypothetical protein